jgi:hypothetical protein
MNGINFIFRSNRYRSEPHGLALTKMHRFNISSLEHCQISAGRLAVLIATTYGHPPASSSMSEQGPGVTSKPADHMPDKHGGSNCDCGLDVQESQVHGVGLGIGDSSSSSSSSGVGFERCGQSSLQTDFLSCLFDCDSAGGGTCMEHDMPHIHVAKGHVVATSSEHNTLPPADVIVAVQDLTVDILLDRDHLLQYTQLQVHEALKSSTRVALCVKSVASPVVTWRLVCLRLAALLLHRTLSRMSDPSFPQTEEESARALLSIRVPLLWIPLVLLPDLHRHIRDTQLESRQDKCFMGIYECQNLANLLENLHRCSETGDHFPDSKQFTWGRREHNSSIIISGPGRREMLQMVSAFRFNTSFGEMTTHRFAVVEVLLLLLTIQSDR